MPATIKIIEAIAASQTKAEVASILGVSAACIGGSVHKTNDPSLRAAWRKLPADGAFAGISKDAPGPAHSQDEADALVAEALVDAPIDVTANQRECIVLLMLALFNITGSMSFPRGWVRALILAFNASNHPVRPTPASLRWYRLQLQNEPQTFASVWGADPKLIEDLVERAGGE